MTNSEKELWFAQISEQQNYQIEIVPLVNRVGTQSIQMRLPCGCVEVDQYVSPTSTETNTSLSNILMGDNREQYFQFCHYHTIHSPSKQTNAKIQLAKMIEYSYELKVPKNRVAVIIGREGSVKKEIEEELKEFGEKQQRIFIFTETADTPMASHLNTVMARFVEVARINILKIFSDTHL